MQDKRNGKRLRVEERGEKERRKELWKEVVRKKRRRSRRYRGRGNKAVENSSSPPGAPRTGQTYQKQCCRALPAP
jgi:hypothetical protein